MKIWNGIDDLDFYVDTMVVPEEAEKFTRIYRINAFRVKANDLDMDADDIYGKENKEIRDEPKEIPLDKLLLDGVDIEFPGDECILKGIRRPGDNTRRYIATRKANAKALNGAITIGTHVTINRGENGNTSPKNREEWLKTTVAAKKKPKSDCRNYFKKADRRKSRHSGKAECREVPVYIDNEAFETENPEVFPEREDGTVDIDAVLVSEYEDEWEGECKERMKTMADECLKEMGTFTFPAIVFVTTWDNVEWGVNNEHHCLGVVNNIEEGKITINKYFDDSKIYRWDNVHVKSAPINGISYVGGAFYVE